MRWQSVCSIVKGSPAATLPVSIPEVLWEKRLYLKVADIFPNNQKPAVSPTDSMSNVIMEISSKRLGVTAVVENEKLLGIITDGDLRRVFGKSTDLQAVKAADMMSVNPKTAQPEMMAVDALQIMKQFNITSLVVGRRG